MLSASSWRMRRSYTVGIGILLLILVVDMFTMFTKKGLPEGHYNYSIVKGVFTVSDDETDYERYNFAEAKLGLLDRAYEVGRITGPDQTDWSRLYHYVIGLNDASDRDTKFKLFFLTRHGEGMHNLGERKYGTGDWDKIWSKKEGDEEMRWADAHLSNYGENQVRKIRKFFTDQIGMPAMDSYYTSPLSRCLQTCYLTFNGMDVPYDRPFKPIIKEYLRETIGEHTCDRRSSASELRQQFSFISQGPFQFEDGFTEKDELWTKYEREYSLQTQARVRNVLDEIFDNDPGLWVSINSHSGTIRAMLDVVNHRLFPLVEGGMIAVLVKAEKKKR